MFEKLLLKIDVVSVDGAGCHPPPFLLKDGCYILHLVNLMQCEILMIAVSCGSLPNEFVLAKQTK